MFDILCVTNRTLCKEEFLSRIETIAECAPAGIILREKDLSETAYTSLAKQVLDICGQYDVPCILHSLVQVAIELGAGGIHLPLPILRTLTAAEKACFTTIGASCHSVEEAVEAQHLGCTYISAGHIFATDCKKGVPPKGIDFLRGVCAHVTIPVYAIGGIHSGNIGSVRRAGAKGACVMSGAMCCEDVSGYFAKVREKHEI